MKPDYKTIYLVPTDVEAGQVTYSWCDCPTPGEGMREEDATRYVREDLVPASNQVLALRIAELERQKSELMAQVEAFGKLHTDLTNADMVFDGEDHSGYLITNDQLNEMEFILLEPAKCLAEIKALAVESARAKFKEAKPSRAELVCVGWVADCLQELADQLRQQAKGE